MNIGKLFNNLLLDLTKSKEYVLEFIESQQVVRSRLRFILDLENNTVLLRDSENYHDYLNKLNDWRSMISFDLNVYSVMSKYNIEDLYYYFQTKDDCRTPNLIDDLHNFIESEINSGNLIGYYSIYRLGDSRDVFSEFSINKLRADGTIDSDIFDLIISDWPIKPAFTNELTVTYLKSDRNYDQLDVLKCKLSKNFKFNKTLIKEIGRDELIKLIEQVDSKYLEKITTKELRAIYDADRDLAITIMSKLDLVINNMAYLNEAYKSEFVRDILINSRNIYAPDAKNFFKPLLAKKETRKVFNTIQYLESIIKLDKIIVSPKVLYVIDVLEEFKGIYTDKNDLYINLINKIREFEIKDFNANSFPGLVEFQNI